MPAMIKSTLLPGLAALGLAFSLYAQSEADYAGWMKDLGATRGKMQKAIAAKQGPEAAAEAEKLAGIYKNMIAFWEGRKADDAVELSKKGHTALTELAAAAKAGDEAKVTSSMQAFGSTCSACHMAHREGSAGSYKIK
jgi:mono/diheme cytochrome c family protein